VTHHVQTGKDTSLKERRGGGDWGHHPSGGFGGPGPGHGRSVGSCPLKMSKTGGHRQSDKESDFLVRVSSRGNCAARAFKSLKSVSIVASPRCHGVIAVGYLLEREKGLHMPPGEFKEEKADQNDKEWVDHGSTGKNNRQKGTMPH